jgi:hypothetical protein
MTMAGSAEPEETPKFGWKATAAALVFALAVLGGFGVATAIAVDGDSDDDHGEEHSEEAEDHDEAEDHSDEG